MHPVWLESIDYEQYDWGTSNESIKTWEMIKHVAGLQEALAGSAHIRQHQRVNLSELLDPWNHVLPLSGCTLEDRFRLPCDLLDNFYVAVRHITQCSSFINFDREPGALWNTEDMVAARKAWNPQQFADEWYFSIMGEKVPLPPGGFPASMKMYELQALQWGTLPWKWEAQDGTESLEHTPQKLASNEVFKRN
ncbi:hypothetical protein EJ02DRAFT_50876 [Clathrospora elynae]|uniref:Uncharacterized protein n=1 Tax=Clathrospora elynae TaxID=706981 RepID=A0A6A5SC56_9PLEO|nr:hypothetical protein EJ02DRAFT_50876 [Clathrospora elynae]